MSTRTEIAKLREQVDRFSTATVASRSEYSDDPCKLMEAGGIEPSPWQREVLMNTTDDFLIVCARQSGKSSTAAVRALATALFEPASTILVISPSLRQSQELTHKIAFWHRAAGEVVALEALSTLKMAFANRSRIFALPASQDTIRGFSAPRLILVDEAGFLPDQLMFALSPMLSTTNAGQLIVMGTPNGQRGWLWKEWSARHCDYKRIQVRADECQHIDPGYLRKERRRLPRSVYESEYECIFGDAISSCFRTSDVLACFTDRLEPLIYLAA